MDSVFLCETSYEGTDGAFLTLDEAVASARDGSCDYIQEYHVVDGKLELDHVASIEKCGACRIRLLSVDEGETRITSDQMVWGCGSSFLIPFCSEECKAKHETGNECWRDDCPGYRGADTPIPAGFETTASVRPAIRLTESVWVMGQLCNKN